MVQSWDVSISSFSIMGHFLLVELLSGRYIGVGGKGESNKGYI